MNIKALLYSTISLLVCAGIYAAELTEAEKKAAVVYVKRIAQDYKQQAKLKKEKNKIVAQQQKSDQPQLLKHKLLLKNENYEIPLDPVLLQASKTLQDVLENADTEAVIPIEANQQTIDLLVGALKDHTTLRSVPYNELIKLIELYDFLHIQSTELSLEYLFETIEGNYSLDDLTPDLQELFLRYHFKEYVTKNTFKFDAGIYSVALSADGSIAMAGSYDTTAKIVDVKTGNMLHTLQFNNTVNSVALSADGSIAIAGSEDKTAKVVDVKTGDTLHTLQFTDKVTSVALSANGSIAIAGSWDTTIQIVNVKTGEILHVLQFAGTVTSIALSANGSTAIVGLRWGNAAEIIDVKTGEILRTLQFTGAVNSIALSANGSIAIAGSSDGVAQIMNVKTGRPLQELQFNAGVHSVALSADDSIVIVGLYDNTVQIMNIKTGKFLPQLQFNDRILSAALSADGSIAMVGSNNKTAKIVDVKTGNTLHTLQFNGVVVSVALSADGSIAIAGAIGGSNDGNVQLAYLTPSTLPIEILIEKYKTKNSFLTKLNSLVTKFSNVIRIKK